MLQLKPIFITFSEEILCEEPSHAEVGIKEATQREDPNLNLRVQTNQKSRLGGSIGERVSED